MIRGRARLLAWVALGLGLSGCRFVGAADNNLRELHTEDGMHRRMAKVMTHYGYATRVGVVGLLRSVGVTPKESDLTKIKDPLESCVDSLNDLASFDSQDPWVRALQVEHFSRIALSDPWKLSREIAVKELGRLGARLRSEGGEWAPPRAAEGADFATADEVASALQKLVRAANVLARGGSLISESGLKDEAASLGLEPSIESSCAALGALVLDLNGAQRVLRVCALLQSSRLGSDPSLAPVIALRASLERRCISLALRSALLDAPPAAYERLGSDPGWGKDTVQAAAVRASVRVWGAPMLEELLLGASPRSDSPLRLVALLNAVESVGLPSAPSDMDPAQRDRLTQTWLRLVWTLATDHPDGTVRLAGMGALGKISGRGRVSLRDEDWVEWARDAGLLARAAAAPVDAARDERP